MDSVQLSWVRQITVQKSTQVGGTEFLLNVLGYAIAEDPGPILYVLPSKEEGEAFYEERLLPMVRLCEPLASQMTKRKHDAKKRTMRFRRCRLRVRSAGVASELAQFPARFLIGDECDKWPRWTQREAAPFQLAQERTRTFWNHRILANSTPTTADGLIHREFLAGDRRRFFVPCPHCGRFQVLRWQQLKWPSDVTTEQQMVARREAWFLCECCGGRIEDQHKPQFLDRGAWVPEGVDLEALQVHEGRLVVPEDRIEHRSYHIWAAYSPWVQFHQVAAKWLKWKDDPAQLQNFVNSWLGEPWVEKVEDPRPELVRDCVGGYRRGEVPAGVQVLTAGVDVQKRFLAVSVRGWGLDLESWLIDHARVDSFEQLTDLLFRRPWPRNLMVRGLFIDARYRTDEVMDFARRHPGIVRMSKGVERDDLRPFTTVSMDRHPDTGARLDGSLVCYHVATGFFKDIAAKLIRRGAVQGGWHVYEGVDDTYQRELTSEHKILQRTGKKTRERWVPKPGHQQNHFWDTEVLNVAIAHLLGVQQLRDALARRERRRPAAREDDGGDEPETGGRLWRRTT